MAGGLADHLDGAWYDPDSERRRFAAIAEHDAQRLSRTLSAN